MEILRMFIKVVLLLVGLLFLGSGLFCGVIGFTSTSAIFVGVIGLAFAALGYFLILLGLGKLGKKADPENPPGEPPTPGGA